MLQPVVSAETKPENASDDLNLLEALTHEVRTPLATIRTLVRSLVRRKDLPDLVMKRLQQIDVECSEQIDRFGLIFDVFVADSLLIFCFLANRDASSHVP